MRRSSEAKGLSFAALLIRVPFLFLSTIVRVGMSRQTSVQRIRNIGRRPQLRQESNRAAKSASSSGMYKGWGSRSRFSMGNDGLAGREAAPKDECSCFHQRGRPKPLGGAAFRMRAAPWRKAFWSTWCLMGPRDMHERCRWVSSAAPQASTSSFGVVVRERSKTRKTAVRRSIRRVFFLALGGLRGEAKQRNGRRRRSKMKFGKGEEKAVGGFSSLRGFRARLL